MAAAYTCESDEEVNIVLDTVKQKYKKEEIRKKCKGRIGVDRMEISTKIVFSGLQSPFSDGYHHSIYHESSNNRRKCTKWREE